MLKSSPVSMESVWSTVVFRFLMRGAKILGECPK